MMSGIDNDTVLDPQYNDDHQIVRLIRNNPQQKRQDHQQQQQRQCLHQKHNAFCIAVLSFLVFSAVNIPFISARQQQHHVTSMVPKKPFTKQTTTRPVIPSKQKKLHSSSSSKQHDDIHEHSEELMTAPTAVANVLADLCPHGMLPIAFGMAAAGGTGPVLATIILFIFGALSWYSLVSFARAAEITLVQKKISPDVISTTNTKNKNLPLPIAGESLSAVWERTVPNGSKTKFIPDLGCVCLTVGCLLFYSAFIGDLFGSLVSGITLLPNILRKRWTVLLILHAIPILPLCLLKDLSALKYSSMTGLIGIVYTIFFTIKRLIDGSYANGGKFYNLMPSKFQPAPQINFPHTSSKSILGYVADLPLFHSSQGLLTLMNMCCVAYACHYNAVKYYMELKTRTVPAFQGVMAVGIGGTAFVFWCMMIFGYATFGIHSQTLLLNNYHPSLDTMATIARTFTGIAIISGYALMFAGFKAALFSVLKLDQPNIKNRTMKQNLLSFISLAAIAVAACFVTEHELGTVIGIVGSVFGSVVIYMFPAIVNNSLLQKKDKHGKLIAKPFFYGEQIFNNIMILFGIVFAILGTWISLKGDEHH